MPSRAAAASTPDRISSVWACPGPEAKAQGTSVPLARAPRTAGTAIPPPADSGDVRSGASRHGLTGGILAVPSVDGEFSSADASRPQTPVTARLAGHSGKPGGGIAMVAPSPRPALARPPIPFHRLKGPCGPWRPPRRCTGSRRPAPWAPRRTRPERANDPVTSTTTVVQICVADGSGPSPSAPSRRRAAGRRRVPGTVWPGARRPPGAPAPSAAWCVATARATPERPPAGRPSSSPPRHRRESPGRSPPGFPRREWTEGGALTGPGARRCRASEDRQPCSGQPDAAGQPARRSSEAAGCRDDAAGAEAPEEEQARGPEGEVLRKLFLLVEG